jgi:hypothetical protein
MHIIKKKEKKRNKAKGLKNSWLVLEQWILLLVSWEEHSLGVVEKGTQAFAFVLGPSSVFYWFIVLVFSENKMLDSD